LDIKSSLYKIKISLIVVFTVALLFCGQSMAKPDTSRMLDQPGHLVFLVQSNKGQVLRHAGQYYLRLDGVVPYVIYLTDPPKRMTGMVSTARFLSSFAKSHYQHAPRAALIYAEHPNLRDGVRVRLSAQHPKQIGRQSWLFEVRVVAGTQPLKPMERLTNVVLVINNE
jgi:hypothetical protein